MSSPQTQPASSLSGLRALVVEDQYLIARDICRLLLHLGCEPVGPVPNLAAAFGVLKRETPDCALLDINLGTELVYPLAGELRQRAVPFLFVTGYDWFVVAEPFRSEARLEKPFGARELARALARAMAPPQSAA